MTVRAVREDSEHRPTHSRKKIKKEKKMMNVCVSLVDGDSCEKITISHSTKNCSFFYFFYFFFVGGLLGEGEGGGIDMGHKHG